MRSGHDDDHRGLPDRDESDTVDDRHALEAPAPSCPLLEAPHLLPGERSIGLVPQGPDPSARGAVGAYTADEEGDPARTSSADAPEHAGRVDAATGQFERHVLSLVLAPIPD